MKDILVNIILITCACEFFGGVIAALGKPETCKSEGFECTSNDNCCSEFCDKDLSEKFGVCRRACGTTVSNLLQRSSSEEMQTKYGDFPWNAGIYEFDANNEEHGSYSQYCSGTLISHTTVISAATCFVLDKLLTINGLYRTEKIYKRRLSGIKIGLGKYHKHFNASEDTFAQIFDVKSVEFSPGFEKSLRDSSDLSSEEYKALNYPYSTDEIAIITLNTEVEYTRAVRPVCVDVGPYNFEKSQVVEGAKPKMACWLGNETLHIAEVDFVPRAECGSKIISTYYGYLSAQKICVDFTCNNTEYAYQCHGCPRALGAGLVFEDPKTKTYYLRGINTVAHTVSGTIPFAKLSSQKELVEKFLDDCKRVCRRTCGISNSKPNQPTCSNGRQIEHGEFPWHAGIYYFNATLGYHDLLCGGTLISHKVVITAAHCFKTTDSYRSKIYTKDVSTLKVALGKFHRNLNAQDVLAQIVDVESIEYSPEFIRMEANDIAIVILKNAVEFSKAVQPICIDTEPERFDRERFVKGAKGKIVGWEVKRPEFDDPLEETGEITTPSIEEAPTKTQPGLRDRPTIEEVRLVPIEECVAGELQYISKDIICGNKTKPKGEGYYAHCKNYLGRGLVFEDPKTKKYYLRGIASLTGFVCAETNFFPYTKLSFHKELVEKYLDVCEGGCRRNLCEPLISKKLHINCLSESNQLIRCDKPLPANSKAIFSCNPLSYMEVKRSEYNVINCKNGRWDRSLVDEVCVPAYAECGKPVSNNATQAVVKNGKETKYGDFPWHVGIYEYDPSLDSYEQICGGTLISHKVVVSAAHCFEREIKNRRVQSKVLSTLKVGLGKYHRNLTATEDGLAQIVDIELIEIPQEYLSHMAQYTSDIAFVTLKTQVEYTRAVLPACIDVGPNNFENDQLTKGATGKIVGWGLTANNEASETLILAEMPFVPRDECRRLISGTLVGFLRGDKICAGDQSSNVTVCQGDSGGGLVFEDQKSEAYYLRGIVSLGPKGCKAPDFALFTRLSSHRDLLEKYLRL